MAADREHCELGPWQRVVKLVFSGAKAERKMRPWHERCEILDILLIYIEQSCNKQWTKEMPSLKGDYRNALVVSQPARVEDETHIVTA